MAYRIKAPRNSFVQFDPPAPLDHCIWGRLNTCLPILLDTDVRFQFVIEGDTPEEADALCDLSNSLVDIGLISDCDAPDMDILFTELPERFRINELQVLYNWNWGLPGAIGFYDLKTCFQIVVEIDGERHCSNCFQRILKECFSSVLEYANEEDGYGFWYCGDGEVPAEGATGDCFPTEIEFFLEANLTIPYTASLAAKYGAIPSVQVWIFDTGGELVNMGIVASFDAMPPSLINLDFGGIASGVVRIGL